MEYIVNLTWDPDASVWVATSDDIDALLERVRFAAPELLALNQHKGSPLTLTFHSERRERIAM